MKIDRGTKAQRHKGTKAQRHKGTSKLWPALFIFLSAIPSVNGQSSRVTFEGNVDSLLIGHFTLGPEVFSRTIHAPDEKGWCGLWCSLFPQIQKEYGIDTDGDGMSDFEEMILMQNPTAKDPLPRKLTAQEQEEQLALARRRRESRLPRQLTPEEAEKIRAGLEIFIAARKNRNGFEPHHEKRLAASRELARALRKVDAKSAGGNQQKSRANRRARSMGKNSYAAKLIGADQLWPGTAGSTFGANGSNPAPTTGLPLLPPIGLWDLGAVDLANNQGPGGNPNLGFGPQRVIFGDSSPYFEDHPSKMAKIIGWDSGSDTLRGLAWQAQIKSFDIDDDYPEMLEEATNQGMIFSNHSYSPEAGWKRDIGTGVWEWWGPPTLTGEDPEFGAYSLNAKTIDGIIYRAQTYLPVFSAGNDATDHGPIIDSTGLIDPNDTGYYYSNLSIEEDANGNFQKVSAPANPAIFHPSDSGIPQGGAVKPETIEVPLEHYGTGPIGLGLGTIKSTGSAKNNLTVGAALSDTFTVTDSDNVWLGVVSSRGPTDDHRLKPDLVASGSYNFLGYGSGRYGTTSEATATVTGLLGQLNEINVDGNGPEFLASTWKALLLNTTIDGRNLNHFVGDEFAETFTRVPTYLGDGGDGPGDPPVLGPSEADLIGPDPFFGYGMANAPAAAGLLRKNLASPSGAAHLRQHLLFDPSSQGDNLTIEIPIEHDGSSPEMRITLCWTDPPYQAAAQEPLDTALFDPDLTQTPNTNARLVNDLDLRVITPTLTELEPWAPDFSAPLQATPTGDNTKDNVEQIVISTPVAGTYMVKVSHKGTLKSWEQVIENPEPPIPQFQLIPNQHQSFSLAISGNIDPQPNKLSLALDLIDFQAGGDLINLTLNSFIGLRCQLEGSEDLIQWVPEGDPFHVATSPQPLTRFYTNEHKAKRFYRVRVITPLAPSN